MKRFQIFLSHCADGPETVIVEQFYELLCEAFNHEKNHEKEERSTIAIEYDRRTFLHAGDELRPGCVDRVCSSDLVICCFFPRYLEASYFKDEVDAALNRLRPIIEVRFIPRDNPMPYLHIGRDFDPRLEEEEGNGRPRRKVIEIQYDSFDPARVRETIRRYVAGGDLVDAIRGKIIERAQRDLTMFSSAEEVIKDLAENTTTSIRFFLYDGGTTLRKLQANMGFLELLKRQGPRLIVDFLYVDTACKTYLSETPEYKGSGALQAMDDRTYSAVYEALCRGSGLIHNQSPHGHMADVALSRETLHALKDEFHFQLNIRKTCQLPIYRLIISRDYVYYTHILPQFSFVPKQGAQDYYSLRLSTKSTAGDTLLRHYERLWKSGTPDA